MLNNLPKDLTEYPALIAVVLLVLLALTAVAGPSLLVSYDPLAMDLDS